MYSKNSIQLEVVHLRSFHSIEEGKSGLATNYYINPKIPCLKLATTINPRKDASYDKRIPRFKS